MALHPRAQIKLLRYLEEQSAAKRLTVIFSTHSVTLLKSIKRQQIIYLDKAAGGEIRSVVGCYPTYALGNIASDEETLPDAMLYVEDLYARDMLTAYLELFANERYADPTLRPTAKIVPVGGFNEVVAFLDRNRAVLPVHVAQRAVLDQDVSTESLRQMRAQHNHAQLAKFQRVQASINYLPFTPEVGLMTEIFADPQAFEQSLRQRLNDNQLRIEPVVAAYDPTLNGAQLRNSAKQASNALLSYLEQRTQKSNDSVREHLCGVFATRTWGIQRAAMFQLFGPIFP